MIIMLQYKNVYLFIYDAFFFCVVLMNIFLVRWEETSDGFELIATADASGLHNYNRRNI